jgi:manganese/iron transport system substrate-binding protein
MAVTTFLPAGSRPSRRTPPSGSLTVGLLLAGLVAACSSGVATPSPTSPVPGGQPIDVVTTTTVFADLIANVGGSHVTVTSLVPASGDVHTYEPKPTDVRAVSDAQLIVMNGLGLDDWLDDTITSASTGAPVLKLGVNLPGVELLPGEEPDTQNPHLWMDVKYAELYVDRIDQSLESVDPDHAADYQASAAAYSAQLAGLDTWVRQQIATIPEANRKLVSFHDAFPYFAREYGITIVGVAVEAPGQDPSAAYTAQLIQAIKAAGVKAIFSEDQFPTKLVDQLAEETGAKVVADLYDDALGDPPVTSYIALITWDVNQLVDALG